MLFGHASRFAFAARLYERPDDGAAAQADREHSTELHGEPHAVLAGHARIVA
jgi:hypothetical protein